MKAINELNMPDDIRYADDHEWARLEGNAVRIGLDRISLEISFL
jgi:glycine cleavage system H protein